MPPHCSTKSCPYCRSSHAPPSISFELRLLSPLAPGQEATISYGDNKPNAEVGGRAGAALGDDVWEGGGKRAVVAGWQRVKDQE